MTDDLVLLNNLLNHVNTDRSYIVVITKEGSVPFLINVDGTISAFDSCGSVLATYRLLFEKVKEHD